MKSQLCSLCLCLFIVTSCSEESHERNAPGGTVVTLFDYFRLGEEQVDRHLASRNKGSQQAKLEAAMRAVTRVRVRHSFRNGDIDSVHGTATLVDGGEYAVTQSITVHGEGEFATGGDQEHTLFRIGVRYYATPNFGVGLEAAFVNVTLDDGTADLEEDMTAVGPVLLLQF